MAHDRFQEIIDEANNPQNPLRLKQIILDAPSDTDKNKSIIVKSNLEALISGESSTEGNNIANAQTATQSIFKNPYEIQVAQIAIAALNKLQHSPSTAPTSKALLNNAVQQQLITSVTEQLKAGQQSLPNDQEPIDIAEIVKKATNLMVQQTIDIPRIVVVPKGDVSYGYRPFALNLTGLNLQPSTRDIVIQSLQTNKQEFMNSQIGLTEQLPEDYIVHALIDYDDMLRRTC